MSHAMDEDLQVVQDAGPALRAIGPADFGRCALEAEHVFSFPAVLQI
jgi:hypothetical protein